MNGFGRARSTLALPYVAPFFASNFIQFLCGQIAMLASQWLITDLTESRFLITLVAFAQGGAVVLFSPVAGLIADRTAKRRLLIISRLMLLVIMATLGSLVVSGEILITHVWLCSIAGGITMALSQPASQTFVYDLVGRDRLENAIALNATSAGVAQVLGPAAGGAMLAALGVAATFMGAALGMGLSAGLLLAIPIAGRAAAAARKPGLHEMGEGFVYVWKDRGLRLVILACAMALFNGALGPMRPVFARFVLEVGEVGLGGMAAASGAGTILSAIALASLNRFRYIGLWIAGSMLGFSVCVLLYSFAFSYEYILVMEFLLGVFGQIWNVTVIAGLQLAVPPELRGRVIALIFMIAQLGFLGVPLNGILADRAGDQFALGVFGAFPTVILSLILLFGFRRLKSVGENDDF
jgi:MFS family permease